MKRFHWMLMLAIALAAGMLLACAGDDDDDNDDTGDGAGRQGGCYYICWDDDYCLITETQEACEFYADENCSNLQQLDFVEDCGCDRYLDCSPEWYY